MPTFLYKEPINSKSNETYQSPSTFDLLWYSLYMLADTHKSHRTEHFFLVPPNEPVFLRLFFDTHSSLPQQAIKYMILDSDQTMIHHDSISDTHTPLVLKINSKDKRQPREYKLVMIYDEISTDKECAMLEIFMILQTMERVSQEIRCTNDDIKDQSNTLRY